MKILDKYVARNFLTGYFIAFCVLVGLRVVIDLFVNLDEFTEHADIGTVGIITNIFIYYGLNCTLYFRDFAGMITVIAASFSFGKMVRSGELVAIMASGVSLKRVIAPVILLSLFFTGLFVFDQEVVIPPLADKLVRSEDAVPGEESYDIWFISDSKGSLINSQKFDVKTATLHNPTILTRREIQSGSDDRIEWEAVGSISADLAVFNEETKVWDLKTIVTDPGDPNKTITVPGGRYSEIGSGKGIEKIYSYESDITPKDIPVRRKSGYKTLLSSRQLSELASQHTKIKDLAQLYSQKHFRITEPIINFIMLMLCLPVLVCRDPKTMKTAILTSFGLTGLCMTANFICKLLSTEIVFGIESPEIWAWLPIAIFGPIAILKFDSMKT